MEKKLFFFPFPLLAAKRYLGDGGEAVEEEEGNRRGRSASHENIMSGGGTPFAASPFPPLLDRGRGEKDFAFAEVFPFPLKGRRKMDN